MFYGTISEPHIVTHIKSNSKKPRLPADSKRELSHSRLNCVHTTSFTSIAIKSKPSAGVKNEWSYTCTLPICLHGEHRGKFNFF